MEFKDKSVVVTGGAQGIGKCIAECFAREGATVHVIDVQGGSWFVGDLADKATLERFAADVVAKSGKVDVLVNNAMPLFKGIDECTYEEFAYAQAVGVVAPFYLAKLFKDSFAEGASIINISSSRDRMSQPQSESYTAAKGGIAALTHALAASLAGSVRVNSISPGWIDTSFRKYDGPDALFYADYAKPQGFCDEAWKAIYQYVFALAHGADKSLFYYGDWIKKPGVAIVSCNDGLRPVIMKLEATDEESKIDYHPIER